MCVCDCVSYSLPLDLHGKDLNIILKAAEVKGSIGYLDARIFDKTFWQFNFFFRLLISLLSETHSELYSNGKMRPTLLLASFQVRKSSAEFLSTHEVSHSDYD